MTKKPHIRIHSDGPIKRVEGCRRCIFGKESQYCEAVFMVGRLVRCVKGGESVHYELVSGDVKELMK